MERQNILQNDDWFQPYFQYILSHPQGSTPIKLLSEVDCPQLKMTHITPNIRLLQAQLEKKTKRISEDVPPLLERRQVNIEGGFLYVPSKYALNTYGSSTSWNSPNVEQTMEIDFDDL